MLQDILQKIASEHGASLTDANQKAMLTTQINFAAKEIYDRADIPESLREGLFNIDVASRQIALPSYVDSVRGLRPFNNRIPIPIDSIGNRYNNGLDNETWQYQWREKELSPTQRDITNESRIKITVPLVEAISFTVTIIGPTPNSDKKAENISMPAGTLEVESTNTFKHPLLSITKSTVTSNNVTLLDVEDNVLAVIPNYDTKVFYKIIQILDTLDISIGDTEAGIEILFKHVYIPMINDYDSFMGTDRYDSAIYWKWLEHRAVDADSLERFATKCARVLYEVAANRQQNVRQKMNFPQSNYFGLPYATYSRGYTK